MLFAVAWTLSLAPLLITPGRTQQPSEPPPDEATLREQATLPPGYTVFTIETADERAQETIQTSNAFV
jgi:hypothetical protein